MTNEDDSNEDRLTKYEFAELIQHLSMQEILTIEYCVGNVWTKLFSRKNVLFICNLCVVETSCFKNLLDHINGRRHKMEMERVKQLYHPDYTYPKNEKTESTVPKSNENSVSNVSMSTDAECKSGQEKVENNTSLKNKKNNIKNKNPIGINSEIAPTMSPIQSKLKKSVETSTVNNKRGNNVEARKNDEKLKTSTEINKEQQKINEDKLKNFPNSVDVNESLCKEIAMEDDKICKGEPDKVVDVGNSLSSEESEKNNPTTFEKKTTDTDSKINNECVIKKSKIVVNPAALSLKRNCSVVKENEINDKEKNIKYQTDKIIIPTIHKNKIRDEQNSAVYKPQSNSNDLPKFSVKSYSYKSGDNDVYGILGVEYVIKILRHKNDLPPRYECGLCELVLDGFAMQRHLEGYNHRLKFCEKHFPTAIRHYRQYMQSVPEHELFKVMTPVLERLAMAIEKHHGRNLPYECYERDFSMNRQEILAKAFSCRHASEQYGPTFTHVIGANEIDEYIKSRQNYVPPITSRTAIFDSNSDSSRTRLEPMRNQSIRAVDRHFHSRDGNRYRHAGREATNDLLNNTEKSYKTYMSAGLYDDFYPPSKFYDQSNRNVVQQVDDETYNLMVDDFLKGTLFRESRKRSASPTGKLSSKRRKSLSPLRDNDIWQAYRHLVDQELNNLDEKYKQYRKDLEKHPSYNEEWQKFWKRRKDELKSTGLDHRTYNYQPEWVKFIKIRIEELYNQEVENIMINCRERLCLPMTNNSLLDTKYHVRNPKFSNETCNLSHTSETKSAGVLLQDSPTMTSGKGNVPQVVPVLRLMTALEDSLGSLGPKIIDLLSKALQVEKTSPTQVNSLILSNANCSLIETAKEKLKGLVITGLYESSKEKVLKQVINDAEDLLKYSYQNRELLSYQRPRPSDDFSLQRTQSCATLPKQSQIEGSLQLLTGSQTSSSSLTENLLTRLDKKELASKLAASLVAQGKTDFEPEQLQKIISVYNLIEKKKLVSSLSMKETEILNKKKLSDTLSDLLNPSSTSIQNKDSVHQQKLDDRSSKINTVQQTNFGKANSVNSDPKTSFNSVSQNSSDNYLINSAYPQLTGNAYGICSNRATQYSDCSTNYTGNQIPYQQNTTYYNNDLYQNNNRNAQSWDINYNMEMNSNYNMSGPNNYNQRTNWRNF